jgi:hypothetical protein
MAAPEATGPAVSDSRWAAASTRALGGDLCHCAHVSHAGLPRGHHHAAAGDQPSHRLCVSAMRGSSGPKRPQFRWSTQVLTPSIPDLIRRWRESGANSAQLWQEIQALG